MENKIEIKIQTKKEALNIIKSLKGKVIDALNNGGTATLSISNVGYTETPAQDREGWIEYIPNGQISLGIDIDYPSK